MNTLIKTVSYRPFSGPMLAPLLLITAGSLLALSLVVAKLALSAGAAPLAFLLISCLLSGLLLLAVALFTGQAVRLNMRIVEYGLVAGALFALPNAIAFAAVSHVGAGFLSLTFAFPILVTYLLALVLRMERFQTRRMLGVGVAMAGGMLMATSKLMGDFVASGWVILALSMPLIIAVANIYRTRRWPSGVSSVYLRVIHRR